MFELQLLYVIAMLVMLVSMSYLLILLFILIDAHIRKESHSLVEKWRPKKNIILRDTVMALLGFWLGGQMLQYHGEQSNELNKSKTKVEQTTIFQAERGSQNAKMLKNNTRPKTRPSRGTLENEDIKP